MSTAMAPAQSPTKALTIKQHLNSEAMQAELAKVLPKHLSAERMARVAITALTRTPKLQNCDQASFFKCLLDLSAWGLEPDGRRAHLIPFENKKRGVVECQLILDYKGLVELAYRSGVVSTIHADVVHRGDLLEYDNGYITKHVPWFLRDPDNRPKAAGEIYAAFSIVSFKDGRAKHEVMSKDEIEGIRKRSRAGNSGPWVTDWNEMAKKTVFRRLTKWLPLSAEVNEAIDRDDDKLPPIEQERRVAVSHDLMDRLMGPAPESDPHTIDEAHDAPPDDANQDTGEVPLTAEDDRTAYLGHCIEAYKAVVTDAEFTAADEAAFGERGLDWNVTESESLRGVREMAHARVKGRKGAKQEQKTLA